MRIHQPVHIYEHQLTVINVFLKVSKSHPDATWITERRLARENYVKRIGKKEHLPDAVLVLPDGSQIAIEVEISLKARKRLDEILTDYALQSIFKEVWYFCSQHVQPVLRELSDGIPCIKIHPLEKML